MSFQRKQDISNVNCLFVYEVDGFGVWTNNKSKNRRGSEREKKIDKRKKKKTTDSVEMVNLVN